MIMNGPDDLSVRALLHRNARFGPCLLMPFNGKHKKIPFK